MDNKIDWDSAPKWANKYGLAGMLKYPVWFDHEKYEYLLSGNKYYYADNCTFKQLDIDFICERPKQWSGPEDGLPPIGVEFEWRYGTDEWKKGKALYFGMVYAILRSHDGEQHYYLREMEFRAIRTPEQIARDLRETKIVEFMNTVGIDCRITAIKAVDAGYVLEVE